MGKSAKEILSEYIEEQGKRKTPERNVVLDVVLKSEGHHSADELRTMLPKKYPISRATVYSTLSLLDEVGLVYSHQVQGRTLYENAFGVEPHHHYICKGCGKIWDLYDPKISEVAQLSKTPRFRKMRSTMYIYGLCDVCGARLYRLRKKMEKERLEKMTREERRFARIDEELSEVAKWFNQNK